MEITLQAGLRKIGNFNSNSDRAQRYVRDLRRYVCSWCAAFKLCHGIDSYRAKALDKIDTTVAIHWKNL